MYRLFSATAMCVICYLADVPYDEDDGRHGLVEIWCAQRCGDFRVYVFQVPPTLDLYALEDDPRTHLLRFAWGNERVTRILRDPNSWVIWRIRPTLRHPEE